MFNFSCPILYELFEFIQIDMCASVEYFEWSSMEGSTHIAERDRRHRRQHRLQRHRQLAVALQQIAALRRVAALLDALPVAQLQVARALLARVHRVGEIVARLHQTVGVVQRLRFARVGRLERVHLDVLDGARLDLVGVALVRAVLAGERDVRTQRGVLDIGRVILLCSGGRSTTVRVGLTLALPNGTSFRATFLASGVCMTGYSWLVINAWLSGHSAS